MKKTSLAFILSILALLDNPSNIISLVPEGTSIEAVFITSAPCRVAGK